MWSGSLIGGGLQNLAKRADRKNMRIKMNVNQNTFIWGFVEKAKSEILKYEGMSQVVYKKL